MNIQNLSGQVLGQYELRDILGFGGMGVVYRGRQTNLDREVAIKVLVPGLANEPGYVERFYREAKTAAGLEHSHIVPVYDYGVQGEISYVVMRLLTGGTLEQRITQRAGTDKALPSLGEISELLKQLASALDYAHSRGVIHRDIKPGNIMFDDQGQA
jgi:serine/threonine protein kinase